MCWGTERLLRARLNDDVQRRGAVSVFGTRGRRGGSGARSGVRLSCRILLQNSGDGRLEVWTDGGKIRQSLRTSTRISAFFRSVVHPRGASEEQEVGGAGTVRHRRCDRRLCLCGGMELVSGYTRWGSGACQSPIGAAPLFGRLFHSVPVPVDFCSATADGPLRSRRE